MPHTSFLNTTTTSTFANSSTTLPRAGEPASLSLTTTPHDLSLFGRAILSSRLLSPSDTRRWLKPHTSTSNLRNAVGAPWEIYHFSTNATAPVIDIYTKTGAIGRYAAYFGLAPTHDVGFAILAHDAAGAPDLNAHADVALGALLAVDAVGRAQAKQELAGTYRGTANSSILVSETGEEDPGLAVERFVVEGVDWRARLAVLSGVADAADLDFRLYPTNLREVGEGGAVRQVFRAVFQDKSAPVDQGTPTCVTWMDVDSLKWKGKALDTFVFEVGGKGNATSITVPAFGVELWRR